MGQAHFGSNSKFNSHKYIKRSMEDDFKMVVGIRSIFQSHMPSTITLTMVSCSKDFFFLIYFVPIFAVFLYGFLPSSFCFSMSTVNLSLSLISSTNILSCIHKFLVLVVMVLKISFWLHWCRMVHTRLAVISTTSCKRCTTIPPTSWLNNITILYIIFLFYCDDIYLLSNIFGLLSFVILV